MASSRYEVEVTVSSARDLKNVNWRYGDLRAYAVVWIDPASKCSTKVDVEGDVNPVWEEKLKIPIHDCRMIIEDSTLFIDIVHAKSNGNDQEAETKPLIGSARLSLQEVIDEAGIGGKLTRSLKLKRPSGRPQGKLEVKVAVREPAARYNYDPYAPPYGQSTQAAYQYAGGKPYGQPQPQPQPQYGYSSQFSTYGTSSAPPAAAAAGYPYNNYTAPAAVPNYYGTDLIQGYRAAPNSQAAPDQVTKNNNKSKFGMGTGLAVGAAAGILGGLALGEGIDYVEDKIADKVEDDLAYNDDIDGAYDADDF